MTGKHLYKLLFFILPTLGIGKWADAQLDTGQKKLADYYFIKKKNKEGITLLTRLAASYKNEENLNGQAEALRTLAEHVWEIDTTWVLKEEFIQQGIIAFRQSQNKKEEADLLKLLADLHLQQSKHQQAETELLQVINLYKQAGYPKLQFTYDLLAGNAGAQGNSDKQIQYGREAIRYMETTGDSNGIEVFYGRLVDANERLGRNREAAEWAMKVVDFYRRSHNIKAQADALKSLADLYLAQGNYQLAETELFRVIELYKQAGYPKLQFTYDLLAAVATAMGALEKQLKYSLEAVRYMEITGDSSGAFVFYSRLADAYARLGNTAKSMEAYRKALEDYMRIKSYDAYFLLRSFTDKLISWGKPNEALAIIAQIKKDLPPISTEHKMIIAQASGNTYNKLKQYSLAEKSYLDMQSLGEKAGYISLKMAITWFAIGSFYYEQKQYQQAHNYLTKVEQTPRGTGEAFLGLNTEMYLYKTDSSLGKYQEALLHFVKHKALNDSIFNEARNKQAEELQVQYETKKKDDENHALRKQSALLNNQSLLQKKALDQASVIRNITLACVTSLLLILALLYNRYRIKQKSNLALELKQKEINDQNNSLQKLVTEKEWLLKEVHHRVKNNLQITISLLNAAQDTHIDNEAAFTAIRDSENRIQAMSLIHQKLYQSDNMSTISMPEYIGELAGQLQDNSANGHRIHFILEIASIDLDVAQAVPVGLILNEAITNSIKYGFPAGQQGIVTIHLQPTEDNTVLLTIADNGRGLPPDFDINNTSSFGLTLVQGLTKQLGGIFSYKNNKGLQLTIRFPLRY